MLPLRRPKASAFPHRQPPSSDNASTIASRARHSSFGRLLLGEHQRVAAGQYRRTTDSTVKVKGSSTDEFAVGSVMLGHSGPLDRLARVSSDPQQQALDIHSYGLQPRPTDGGVFAHGLDAGYCPPLDSGGYSFSDEPSLDQLAGLSYPSEQYHAPPKTKLSRGQVANFRKVSARRATLPPESFSVTDQISAPSGSSLVDKHLPATQTTLRRQERTPKKRARPTPVERDSTEGFLAFSSANREVSAPSAPRHHTVQTRTSGITSTALLPRDSNLQETSPHLDCNRPLPPLPTAETESPKSRFGIKLRRKAVPIKTMLGGDEEPAFNEPFVASKFLREVLEISKENQRKLSLQQELDRAVAAHGKELQRVESALIEDLTASFASSSSNPSDRVTTPTDERSRPDTSRDHEMALRFQAVLDHMEGLHVKYDADKERVEAFKDANEIIYRLPGDPPRRHDFTPVDGDMLGHCKTTHAQAASTTPPSTPFKRKLIAPFASLVRTSHIDPALEQPTQTLPSPSPLYGRIQPLIKHNTVPIGSTEVGQVFIPSGRSFETARNPPRHSTADGNSRSSVTSPNEEHPDIQMLRKALKPVLTGDRVKKVVEGYESRNTGSGTDGRPGTPSSPLTAIGKILERERLTRSNELTQETKRLMADTRRQRRFPFA